MPGQGGFVLWKGPSAFDGAPVVAIVTLGATNRKTGDMDQTWILREDVHPLQAVRTGADASICGDCQHRGVESGHRSCYVTVQHGPAAIWRAYHAGRYAPEDLLHRRIAGHVLRFGAYGDPMAVPINVWLPLLPYLKSWTGYTEFWRQGDRRWAHFLMASVQSLDEMVEAQLLGWRTFRVRTGPLALGEVVCPASAEAGHKLTCLQCTLCQGQSRHARSIAIRPHGAGAVNFYRNPQAGLTFSEGAP